MTTAQKAVQASLCTSYYCCFVIGHYFIEFERSRNQQEQTCASSSLETGFNRKGSWKQEAEHKLAEENESPLKRKRLYRSSGMGYKIKAGEFDIQSAVGVWTRMFVNACILICVYSFIDEFWDERNVIMRM